MKNEKELLKTCTGLMKLPKKALKNGAFDMSNWRGGNSPDKPTKLTCECGFRACFIGWLPIFNPKSELKIGNSPVSCTWEKVPTTAAGNFGFGAVATHFDIPNEDAEDLFMPGAGKSDTDVVGVVKAVRAYVKKHGKKKK